MCCKFIVARQRCSPEIVENLGVQLDRIPQARPTEKIKEGILVQVGARCAQDTPTVGTTPVKNCTIKEPPGLHYTSLHYHNLPTFLIV
jgi:hypothetical protein